MSQKRKKPRPEQVAPAEPEAPTLPGHERFRRVLLGLVTAILVARPLVLGEDPGMLAAQTDGSYLVLTLLWLAAVLGWAVWRGWAGVGRVHGGLVELALLVAGVLVAVSTVAAHYKHPAVLIAWEWFGFFVALFVVRQLAVTESDRRHLLAGFLASVVSLSIYTMYQVGVEFPRAYQGLPSLERPPLPGPEETTALGGGGVAASLSRFAERTAERKFVQDREIEKKLERGEANATFAHSSSLAAYLVLFLPVLATAGVLRWREQQSAWKAGTTFGCLFFGLAALYLTRNGSAWLGLAGVACVAAIVTGVQSRAGLMRLGGAAVLLIVVAVVAGPEAFEASQSWGVTWKMIEANPWLGVGGGNFGRRYPQFMAPGGETANDPGNFVLELWSTHGVLALIAVLVALAWFFRLLLRSVTAEAPADTSGTTAPSTSSAEEPEPTRWEFYLWGIAGLLLAYALRAAMRSPEEAQRPPPSSDEIFNDALITGGRAIVWFAAFALFERLRWPGRTLSASLAAGVVAMLVVLAGAGGIDFPSVAGTLWPALGLALAGLELRPREVRGDSPVAVAVPLVLTIGLLVGFVIYPFHPVTSAVSSARSSADSLRRLQEDRESKTPTIRNPRVHVFDRVLKPLEQAVRDDPGEARWHLELSKLYGMLWRESRQREPKKAEDYRVLAIHEAEEATLIDPEGPGGYLVLYDFNMQTASVERDRERKRRQHEAAAKALERRILLDVTDPLTHFRLARVWVVAGNPREAREAAENALGYDELAPAPRRLDPWQRHLLGLWLQ